MAKNTVVLKGNLTNEPFFDYLPGKDGPVPFMRFVLAVERHPPRPRGVDYIQVMAYGACATRSYAYLRAGSEIFVDGWLRIRDGKDERGKAMLRYEVVADELTFLRNIEWERGNEALARLGNEGNHGD